MAASGSRSSHAICESANGNDDDLNVHGKQPDVNEEEDGARGKTLFAASGISMGLNDDRGKKFWEDSGSSLEQDADRGKKLSAGSLSDESESSSESISGQHAAQNLHRFRNEFTKRQELGKGFYGIVFKAKNKLDGKTYAVKRIRPKQDADIPKALREVRALANLTHENIIRYYNVWLEDKIRVSTNAGSSCDESESSSESTPDSDVKLVQEPANIPQRQPAKKVIRVLYIQMELCDCTLQDWLEERNKLPNTPMDYDDDLRPDVKRIFYGILSGVSYIHSKGLLHRDLQPKNIFLLGHGLRVKIGDFGLVKEVCDGDGVLSSPPIEGVLNYTNTNTPRKRTTPYASPELLQGEACDTTSDMFSLGIILFELSNTFTTVIERSKMIEELKNTNRCPGPVEKSWSEKNQLIEDLVHLVPACRPTAEVVLNNPLFTTATEKQVQLIEDLISHVLARRPTAQEVLGNLLFTPLFATVPDKQASVKVEPIEDLIKRMLRHRPTAQDVLRNPLFASLFTTDPDKQAPVKFQLMEDLFVRVLACRPTAQDVLRNPLCAPVLENATLDEVQLIKDLEDLISRVLARRSTAQVVLKSSLFAPLFAKATKDQVQLIDHLINHVLARRPRAKDVFSNPMFNSLFATATEDQVQLIEDLINLVLARRPTAKNLLENPMFKPLFATATQNQVQLMEDLIKHVTADRPTAQDILRNPLFASTTEGQVQPIEDLNNPVLADTPTAQDASATEDQTLGEPSKETNPVMGFRSKKKK